MLQKRPLTPLCLVFFMILWIKPLSALSAPIFDDTALLTESLNSPSSSTSLVTGAAGVTFTVGGSGLTLNEATFGIYGNSPGEGQGFIQLRLYSGATASGTALQSTPLESYVVKNLSLGGDKRQFSGLNWSLAANTQYTVAVFGDADFGGINPSTPRMAVSNLSSGSWTSSGVTFNQFTKSSSTFGGG